MKYVIYLLIILLVVSFVASVVSDNSKPRPTPEIFYEWEHKCKEMGGEVKPTKFKTHLFTEPTPSYYECFIGGKMVVIEGYEIYRNKEEV
jgi:hypothetical protein